MKNYFTIILLFTVMGLNAQEKLPYYEITEAPELYTAGAVSARMVDGLGFRYYWATEGLIEKDLAYKPSETGRTCNETIDHIYGLSNFILNAVTNTINDRSVKQPELNFAEKRKQTLLNFKKASDILRKTDDVSKLKIIFKGKEKNTEFPFWNSINGPIADAIWHAGQVVMMRRASGNPFNSKANVLLGKVME